MSPAEDHLDAILIAAFPLTLAVGVLLIPVVPDYSNHDLAAQAATDSVRWFWGHVLSAAAFGLSVVAASIIARSNAALGSPAPARFALLLVAVGAALHAAGLGADGVGPLALAAEGSASQIFFNGSGSCVPPLFIAGSVVFGVGQLLLILGFTRTVSARLRTGLMAAAIGFSAAEAIPSGWGLYAVGALGLLLYLPVSYLVWHGRARP